MASRIFDFPLPLRPVIELKLSSLGALAVAVELFWLHYLPSRNDRTHCVRLEALRKRLITAENCKTDFKWRLTSIITSITLILVEAEGSRLL
jgi:hypothetical protein